MIARVVVVPHPPLLVPELTPGAGAAAERVRAAAVEAVRWLGDITLDWLAVGADASGPASFGPERTGSWSAYGADIPVTLSAHGRGGTSDLPLPVLAAAWLREQAGAHRVRMELIGAAAAPADCAALGRHVAAEAAETGVLVLGDGAICHGTAAPGRSDDRAHGFDTAVAAALAAADRAALAAIDADLAIELGATGRAAWQVAGAMLGDREWHARMLYSGAPFGVGYHVALWEAV